MTSINLYQASGEGEGKKDNKVNLLDGTFIFSMSIFLLVVLATVGISFYAKKMTKDNDGLAAQIAQAELSSIKSDTVDEVKDFQGRLDAIAQRNDKNVQPTVTLDKTAAAMVDGVVIERYAFDQKTGKLQLALWADDYRKVASQLFNFKDIKTKDGKKVFAQVEIGGIKKEERGINFDVTMVVNN